MLGHKGVSTERRIARADGGLHGQQDGVHAAGRDDDLPARINRNPVQVAQVAGDGLADVEIAGIGGIIRFIVVDRLVGRLLDVVGRGAGVFADEEAESTGVFVGQGSDGPDFRRGDTCGGGKLHERSLSRIVSTGQGASRTIRSATEPSRT